MVSSADSSPLEIACTYVQKCFASFPVIVLGSGHSSAFNIPGMKELTDYICTKVPKEVQPQDIQTWEALNEKLQQMPLEAALSTIQLSQQLTDLIVKKIWDYIFPADKKVLEHVIQDPNYLPLSRLYRHLFVSTNPRIQVITTNYDCIAEYAADMTSCGWTTGFKWGYIGPRSNNHPLRVSNGTTALRMVDIWKVHGSLNWYRAPDGATYCLPSVNTPPPGYFAVIVTPGNDKYRETHREPFRTVITGADAAMDGARSFFCVGYGFNDEHIQPKLLEKCKREEKSIVVLAKELTQAAKNVLLKGQCKHFAAFEQFRDGTRFYATEYPNGVELPGTSLWSLGELLNRVL